MTDLTDPNDNPAPAGPDDELLAELAAVVRQASPAPDELVQAGAASFTWRSIDAELAELAYDSLLDESALAGVRSADAPRALSFETPTLSVDVEVTESGDRRRVLGQVVPPQPADVEVRSTHGTVAVVADDVGRFAVDVAPGPVSLRCRLRGGQGPTLETSWTIV